MSFMWMIRTMWIIGKIIVIRSRVDEIIKKKKKKKTVKRESVESAPVYERVYYLKVVSNFRSGLTILKSNGNLIS